MSRLAFAIGLLIAIAALPVHADDAALSGDVTLTSDYLFRGASQTQGRPALQVGLRYDHATGLYASAWTSNIDYGPGYEGIDREYDVVLGIAREFGALSLDVAHARYLYPGAAPDGALDYSEWLVTAGVGEHWSAVIGWSGDIFATGTPGSYLQLAYTHPLTDAVAFRAAVGEARFSDALLDYRHAELGASWSRGNRQARLTLHTSSDEARENFGSQAARSRVEASVSFGF